MRMILTLAVAALAALATPSTASADPVSYDIWGEATPTHSVADFDTDAVSLSTEFTVSEPGTVIAVRFYKGEGNVRADGDRWVLVGPRDQPSLGASEPLAPADETASGWQTVTLSHPLQVVPGVVYHATYTAFGGTYAYTYDVFAGGPVVSGPITAVGSSYRYVYRYDQNGEQLHGSWRDSSYWVDPVFVPAG